MIAPVDPFLELFRLKPIRIARVSEVSEVTAAAPVPPEERVNFHIGHPLQDSRLISAFLRVALELPLLRTDLTDDRPEALLQALGWEESERPLLEFLIRALQRSIPYMPRGGFLRQNPHPLVRAFMEWVEKQREGLRYESGEKGGRREVILASGGIDEALRILWFTLSEYLEHRPAHVLVYRHPVPAFWREIPHLEFEILEGDALVTIQTLGKVRASSPPSPIFLLIGELLSEPARRQLRSLAMEFPLFFIEANNAPNQHSLARESGLMQRVLRFLTPAVFSPRFSNLSMVFIIGNASFLNAIENVHFNLKGTPSASETELTTLVLQQVREAVSPSLPDPLPVFEPSSFPITSHSAISTLTTSVIRSLDERLTKLAHRINHFPGLETKVAHFEAKLANRFPGLDSWAGMDAHTLLKDMLDHLSDAEWTKTLQANFLSVFLRHHPQYELQHSRVVSGSSRTALGILGFHAGLREAVIPDLSWSYEQCFPVVHAVPLGESLQLDAEAMIARIQELIAEDSSWVERGVVAICNPHNATGRVFDEGALRRLVHWCLEHGVSMVDDLAYQNIVPQDALPHIKTLKEIALDLVREGKLHREDLKRLITVHSLSKIDCLAGARLAVVEIPDPRLRERFDAVNALIRPNQMAILLAYLFYRASAEAVQWYWRLRNQIFHERTQALLEAVRQLPAERNPYDLTILPPQGSMYPLLRIGRLPRGLSLDWLATALARQGIGLLPLSTFARTEQGFELGRTTFRLTLGGSDGSDVLLAKTRRLLILLNRLISEEEMRYNRASYVFRHSDQQAEGQAALQQAWKQAQERIGKYLQKQKWPDWLPAEHRGSKEFQEYVRVRLAGLEKRLLERFTLLQEMRQQALRGERKWLEERLEREFYKDSLARRETLFRQRTHDRTVHPTQMYGLPLELAARRLQDVLLSGELPSETLLHKMAEELQKEYLGINVPINSRQEADEILLDLSFLADYEDYAGLFGDDSFPSLLSFWSDWDGSNRPSGQGHRLVAAVVMENVRRMGDLLQLVDRLVPEAQIEPGLLEIIKQLPARHREFSQLLDSITSLTHFLEQRYRSVLPLHLASATRRFWPWAQNPSLRLWEHNDRYERQMLRLRQQRRQMLDEYFALNKRLRKQLYALIPLLSAHRSTARLLNALLLFHDLMQRFVITPRIHEGMITARDPFAIDTTIFNLHEINAISGTYGNPGMVLALQISMASRPEALIALERKLRARQLQMQREYPAAELPTLRLIPLLEESDVVRNLPAYLDAIWQYAVQSRQMHQSPQERFAQIVAEVFIAGSDLSQQIGQPHGEYLYLKARQELYTWLAHHGVIDAVRIKLGSGEAMQRQGGYYAPHSGRPAFVISEADKRRLSRYLPASAIRSASEAITPLQGIFVHNDLRTIQSNLAEHLRLLPIEETVSLLYELYERQLSYRRRLHLAAEMLTESRLISQRIGTQEMERLTVGWRDPIYEAFLERVTLDFRHILYGREEDVAGIHIISYFLGRLLPQFRDRPASRRARKEDHGYEILSNIVEIIPLTKRGSLLRAIVHNQAQTMVLGINQLTTGLFRALDRYLQTFPEGERERILTEHLLPHLPVYEILHTLRLYQDWQGTFISRLEPAFPAGNSAFLALREDRDALPLYLPFLQRELLRRHGVDVHYFFQEGTFLPALLPNLRPDLAVLLQPDLMNTEIERLLEQIGPRGAVAPAWLSEVTRLLRAAAQIRTWQARIWDLIGEDVYRRVETFMELATALYEFTQRQGVVPARAVYEGKTPPLPSAFLRAARMDDEMRSFLLGALEQLTILASGTFEVPVKVLRALHDVKRLAEIEESALPAAKREAVRFYLLQIARLAGENG